MKQSKVLIADDHVIIRQGLKMILESAESVKVVGEVESGDALSEAVRELEPDLIISDLKMPGTSIIDQCKALKSVHKHLKIMIFTAFEDVSDLYRALEVGIDGYIKKDTHPQQIINAIEMILQGYTCFQSRIDLGQKNSNYIRLTEREREIFQLIINNLSNQEIARELCISEATVKTHVSSILRKTGQPNRSQAVLYAIREGIVPMTNLKGG